MAHNPQIGLSFLFTIIITLLVYVNICECNAPFWCSRMYNPYYPLNPTNYTLPLSNVTAFDPERYPPPAITVISALNPFILGVDNGTLYVTINSTQVGDSAVTLTTTTTMNSNQITIINKQQVATGVSNEPLTFALTLLTPGYYQLNTTITTKENQIFWTTNDLIIALKPQNPQTFVQVDNLSKGLIVNGGEWIAMGYYYTFEAEFVGVMINEAKNSFQSLLPYYTPPLSPQYNDTLNLAASMGLKLHYDIHSIAQQPSSSNKLSLIQETVQQVMHNPGLLAYYIADEPDGPEFGLDPAILEETYLEIKKIDPYHPVTIVLNCVSSAPRYYKSADIIMADPYCIDVAQPVGCDFCTGSPYDIATRVDEINREINSTKPIWLVLQAFGSEAEHWPRLPSPQEERLMTYLAFIHGVTGIHYFLEGIPFSRSLWGECRQLSMEIFQLTPAILSRDPKVEIQLSSVYLNATAFNEEGKGILTILVANPLNEPMMFNFTIPMLAQYSSFIGDVLFQNRKIEMRFGSVVDIIDGFGSRAYRFSYMSESIMAKQLVRISDKNVLLNPSFEDQHCVGMPDDFNLNQIGEPFNTAVSDTRYAVEGYNSLRLINTGNVYLNISCYPIVLPVSTFYEMSFYAKSTEDVEINLTSNCLTSSQTVDLIAGDEFNEYVFSEFQVLSSLPQRCTFTLGFKDAATVWIDMWQLIPQ